MKANEFNSNLLINANTLLEVADKANLIDDKVEDIINRCARAAEAGGYAYYITDPVNDRVVDKLKERGFSIDIEEDELSRVTIIIKWK